VRLGGKARKARERACDDALAGGRSLLDDRRRRARRKAVRDELARDAIQAREPHVNDDRLPGTGETFPVEVGVAFASRSSHQDTRLGDGAMRQGNSDGGGDAGCGGDPRNHLEGDPGARQRERLLATAAEDERIATFQPHDALALARERHQQPVDLPLRHRVPAALLAGVDSLGASRQTRQDLRRNEVVVDHHVGGREQARGLEREQLRVPRPRPHQPDANALIHRALRRTKPTQRAGQSQLPAARRRVWNASRFFTAIPSRSCALPPRRRPPPGKAARGSRDRPAQNPWRSTFEKRRRFFDIIHS